MRPVIGGEWSTVEDVFAAFSTARYNNPRPLERYEADAEILFAWNHSHGYEEQAIVLWRSRENGTLHMIEASHCSCYGYEGQWGDSPIDIPAIKLMWEKPYQGSDAEAWAPALMKVVKKIEKSYLKQ